jgi:hypothetical protein
MLKTRKISKRNGRLEKPWEPPWPILLLPARRKVYARKKTSKVERLQMALFDAEASGDERKINY